MYDDDPQRLYRIFEGRRGKLLLYIGVTDSLPRRMAEHQADKDWFPESGRIVFETYPNRTAVLAAEKKAIRSEHPLHNLTHNPVRIEAGVAAEVELTGNGIAVMVMGAAGLLMLGKWAGDALATWRVRNLATREGREIEIPKVRNPFTEEPPTFLQKVFYGSMFLAATPPPPAIVPGDPKSYEAFEAWRVKNEQLFASFMASPAQSAN
jgi:predicted GIY-YIG superfamily endonuclease